MVLLQLDLQPMSGSLLGALPALRGSCRQLQSLSTQPALDSSRSWAVDRKHSTKVWQALTMSSFDLEPYRRQADTQSCPAEPGPAIVLFGVGAFSALGLFYGFVGLETALSCHAHPSDWLQPCPDTINGPWLPAAIIGLLSLIHAFALGPTICRCPMTS